MTRCLHRSRVLPDPGWLAARLRKTCRVRARLALVLGSGWQQSLPDLKINAEVPYASLPGFCPTGVSGHAGKLIFGELGSVPVVVLSGRAHYYEGVSAAALGFPVRVLAAMGVEDLLLTNAAGGINPRFRPGDFMYLSDHINFLPDNPLRGAASAEQSSFVDLTEVYDRGLNRCLRQAGRKVRARLHGGVYLATAGPCYETPAEIRAFGRWGADAVGMSTVPEAVVARQCGLRVAGLSCITNLAAGRNRALLSHSEVLATGERVRGMARDLLRCFVELYAQRQQAVETP